MKKLITAWIIAFSIMALAGCGNTANSPSAPSNETKTDRESGGSKILVAYFSRAGENYNVGTVEKGNTQIMAEIIAEETGGTLFRIETVNSYPSSYNECTDVAKMEQNENARPELNATVDNFDDYDTIILGYPIWWGDMPMAMYTFLESYDFSGKTILPFNTHEGSGEAGTVSKIHSAVPQAIVLDGLAVQGKTAQESQDSTKTTIRNWLLKSGINN